MSSYIIHICVSDLVKRKLNLTDKFVYGSVLPDILKMANGDRQGTHYLKEVTIEGSKRNLPVIDKAIKELDIQDKEIKMGYIAHLVEDLIWFNDFIPSFAKKIEGGKYQYVRTGEIKEAKCFTKDMYSDYFNCGAYVIESTNTDIEHLKQSIKGYITDNRYLQFVIENTKHTKKSDITNNHFMTKECIDKYIIKATKAVENIMKELIGE